MGNSDGQVASDLAALREQRDEDIDLSDIPELTDANEVVIGRFYRPIKKPVTVRPDSG